MTKLIIRSIARRGQNPAIYSTVFGVLEKLVFFTFTFTQHRTKTGQGCNSSYLLLTQIHTYRPTINIYLSALRLLCT